MIIRPYIPSDFSILGDMLMDEGLEVDDMEYADQKTFVCVSRNEPVGFYTYKVDHDIFPHLQHFCVGRVARNGTLDIARALIKDFCDRIRKTGYHQVFINSPKCKRRISRLIQYYFKASPHSSDNEHKFYLVTV
jgi:hypothetical protein